MKPAFCVNPVEWSAESAALLAVRRAVFVVEQSVPEEEEVDEHDPVAIHFLARSEGVPVGTARLLASGRIGRVAVLRDWRRAGVGRALMLAAIAAARERGDRELHLHAQVHSIPFYESLGFSASGEVFEEAGIPHREMSLRTGPG